MEAAEQLDESVYFSPAQQRVLNHHAGVIAEYAELEGLDIDDVVSYLEGKLYNTGEFVHKGPITGM